MTIYVGNLSYDATSEDLRVVFEEYGTVTNVYLPTDRETDRPRGFAFVTLSTDDQEQNAIETLDGATWMGRNMRVNKAKPKS